MNADLQAVRGMNDIVPPQAARWRELESAIVEVLASYGYAEIRLPIVENSAVFNRSLGNATDIVQKEMYTFSDRNGDSLTLRPEGTAGCVRAALQHGLLQSLPLRVWYLGPMFRHERPQRGRHRQFHQIGVESFGAAGPEADAELILMSARLWRALGLPTLRLELNSLGSGPARGVYREALARYFASHDDLLDTDSRERLARNPLRILDSKNPALQELIAAAPALTDYLDDEARAHFDAVCAALTQSGVEFHLNPRLVRGLDYYSKTVFEWVTSELGAQGTVCAGGRYDGLVELMGGKPTPAVGFAMGLERLLELRAEHDSQTPVASPELYVCATRSALEPQALALAEALRSHFPNWQVLFHIGGGSVKSRMKKADRSGAEIALILGDDEAARAEIAVKPLRGTAAQTVCAQSALADVLAPMLAAQAGR